MRIRCTASDIDPEKSRKDAQDAFKVSQSRVGPIAAATVLLVIDLTASSDRKLVAVR